jgi:hypothetical protein
MNFGINLLNNCKTNILRLLCFKFLAFGNGDANDVQELPKECLKLELFGKVLMALVSINKLLILLRNRWISFEKCLTMVHIHGLKMHLSHPFVWKQYHVRA